MSMEDRVSDVVIDELSFNNKRTASYIKDRQEVIYNVTGSSTYSPTTQTMMTITLNGDTILDQSTLRLNFKVTNTEGASHLLRPLGGGHIFIKRVRLLGKNGVVIHDIQDYGRYCEMMLLMESKHHLDNYNLCGGFGDSINSLQNDKNSGELIQADIQNNYVHYIAGGQYKHVSIPLKLGLFMQSKFLLMRYLSNLVVEITLDNTAKNCVVSDMLTYPTGRVGYVDTDHSVSYVISDVNISVDSLIMDSEFLNNFDSLLLEKNGQINYMCDNVYHTVQTTGETTSLSLNISRSFADLNSVFISFYNSDRNTVDPLNNKIFWRRTNCFTRYNQEAARLNISYNFNCNGKLYPANPIIDNSSQFYNLLKAIGLNNSSYHSVCINRWTYGGENYILGFNFDKSLGVDSSGLNMINSIMQIQLKAYTRDEAGRNVSKLPQEVYILMIAKSKVVVKSTSVDVLD
jgi:hypothetical protein